MRRRDEVIEVTCDRHEAPSRFTWRGARWRVLGIENRWIETGPWWTSAAVRAARGERLGPDEVVETADPHGQADLVDEITVWRVEVANGVPGSRGIHELVHAPARGQWRLRGVLD